MSRLKQLISEVHRRSLWQVLLIYIAASWVVLEAADVLVSRLALPEWVYGAAIVLLLVGLPIVLATAFVQEGVAPERPEPVGVAHDAAKTGTHADEAVVVRRLFTWRNAITGGVLALALWGVVATGWYVVYGGGEAVTRSAAVERPSVAVLPFENRSGLEEDEYFTDGLHDEILTQLSKISGLSVRGRTSVMQYRNVPKNLRQLGEELNARYLLEGGVLRAGETVRINVQLIDAEGDEHLWAETYDRQLSVENLLAVQAEIALRVSGALEAAVTPAEQKQIEARPTDNLGAYDYYLRGNEWWNRGYTGTNWRIAADMYGKAVERDPGFALAYAKLSISHSGLYWMGADTTGDRVVQAKAAVDSAEWLDPELAETHLALGWYHYWGFREYDKALEEFTLAQEIQLSSSEVLFAIGMVQRRLGNFEAARITLEDALELDPGSSLNAHTLGSTNRLMRRYSVAERYYKRALTLSPDQVNLYTTLAAIYLSWDGRTEKARQVLQEASEKLDLADLVSGLARWESNGPFRVLADDFADVLLGLPGHYLEKAQLYRLRNQPQLAHAYFDSARVNYEAELQLQSPLRQALAHVHLGIAYAGLGRRVGALREGEMGTELLPVSKDALEGAHRAWDLAEIYVMVGEYDAAIGQLDFLLSIPASISVPLIRLDPIWDPLREHPRFHALLERYEQ